MVGKFTCLVNTCSPWASGHLRSSALMAMLPGIALPPCSLSRSSATKICNPLTVGHVRTSRLVHDPSSLPSLRYPVVQLQPPYRSFAGTPLLSFAFLPLLCPPHLLRVGHGPFLRHYLLCVFYLTGFGKRLQSFALLPYGFCSLCQWFFVYFLLVLGWFFPSLYLQACSCGECSCGLSGGLFLSLGEMCGWFHTRGTWGVG